MKVWSRVIENQPTEMNSNSCLNTQEVLLFLIFCLVAMLKTPFGQPTWVFQNWPQEEVSEVPQAERGPFSLLRTFCSYSHIYFITYFRPSDKINIDLVYTGSL
uniref:Uncharacterized protein n=1 Tax=Anguilla anguilla TaxID=7936 RepID=A0A0E9X8J8_ANGAN